MATERANPYGVFNFRVEFDNGVVGTFSEVTGLDSEQGVIEYRTGEDPPVMQQHPGIAKFAHVVCKRGIVGGDQLWKWRKQVFDGIGNIDDSEGKSTVTVHLLNEKRESVITWKLIKAWPMKLTGPSLAANKNEVAMESIELVHEGIEVG
jgi:phage tail-like protein